MNFDFPLELYFDLENGLCSRFPSTKRRLSDMKGMFSDENARAALESEKNPLVYEFYELGLPQNSGDIAFGTSIVYPGKVGQEYFMTKGHFHSIQDTAEVYLCLGGRGFMMQENKEGKWDAVEMARGKTVYCPKGFAHRSINTGDEPMITFFAFRADAGHDYGAIETKGFRKLMVELDGRPAAIDNPRWK